MCLPSKDLSLWPCRCFLMRHQKLALGGSHANSAKKQEIEDNSRKVGALFAQLNSGDVSKNAFEQLVQLRKSLDNGVLVLPFKSKCNLQQATGISAISGLQHLHE